MSLERIFPALRFDWPSFLNEIKEDGHTGSAADELHYSALAAARTFSLSMSKDEELKVKNWVRQDQSSTAGSISFLLERAPMIPSAELDFDDAIYMKQFPAPTPAVVMTTHRRRKSCPSRVEETAIESGLMFSGSPLVMDALELQRQVYMPSENSKTEVWEKLIKPFSRAPEIWLCDPYTIEKATHGKLSKIGRAHV